MDNLDDSNRKLIKNLNQLTEEQKLKLFEIEELEGRLETTAWNDACVKTNDSCDTSCNQACPQK